MEYAYIIEKEYEGRRTGLKVANTPEKAKVLARNMVHLSEPADWDEPAGEYHGSWSLRNAPKDTDVKILRKHNHGAD